MMPRYCIDSASFRRIRYRNLEKKDRKTNIAYCIIELSLLHGNFGVNIYKLTGRLKSVRSAKIINN